MWKEGLEKPLEARCLCCPYSSAQQLPKGRGTGAGCQVPSWGPCLGWLFLICTKVHYGLAVALTLPQSCLTGL